MFFFLPRVFSALRAKESPSVMQVTIMQYGVEFQHCTFFMLFTADYITIESAHKVDSEEENSPAGPAGFRTRNLSITG